MKKIDFFKKLKKIIPNHIKPKFYKEIDLLSWNKKQGERFSKSIIQKSQKKKNKNILIKSGIQELYKDCSFQNYHIEHEGHKKAITLTQNYAINFHKNIGNFIFLGKPGTGKNHLATAISKYLISKKKTVLIITISDLMSKIKSTFHNLNKQFTTEKFINYLSKIDLLIIDEIGIQQESLYEKIILDQIIDKRSSSKKSTGMLSNCNIIQIQKILGIRIMDRMKLGNSLWINFYWESYRYKIKNHR
ncbi:ATP-binding protein [Buchnera aphidicola]|uniref:ATP-binding protein n=1 Tax=Buchnera aphidicola TaxID=9 RepID=UPI0031B7FD6C